MRDRGKKRWRRFLLCYSILFLAAGVVGCYILRQYAAAYEASIPEHVMDDFMAATDEDGWLAYIRRGVEEAVSGFEDPDDVFQAYRGAVGGEAFTYRKKIGEYGAETPVYTVRSGGMDLCTVTLAPCGDAGFGRYLWQVAEVTPHLESVTVEIDMPVGDSVYINGVPVDSAYLLGEVPAPNITELESRFDRQPVFARYRVEMYGNVTVTDADGWELVPARDEAGGVVRYVGQEDEFYSFTVRAPETVTVTVNGAALLPSDAAAWEDGILTGLGAYTGGAGYKTLTYTGTGLYTQPEITAQGADGTVLTPLINEKGELIFFLPQNSALAEQVQGRVEEFFTKYIDYSSRAYDVVRFQTLMECILPGTELYSYVGNSRDAMIWASATVVSYDELTFADISPVGPDCFTCTIRYKADFEAATWYSKYSYDLQNAYELAFVRVDGVWYAAAMSVVAG